LTAFFGAAFFATTAFLAATAFLGAADSVYLADSAFLGAVAVFWFGGRNLLAYREDPRLENDLTFQDA